MLPKVIKLLKDIAKIGVPAFFVSIFLLVSFSYINHLIKQNKAETAALISKKERESTSVKEGKLNTENIVYDQNLSPLMKSVNSDKFTYFIVSNNKSFNNGSPTIFYSIEGSKDIHRVVVPQSTYSSIESGYLLPKNINFQFADESFDNLNQEAIQGVKNVAEFTPKAFMWEDEFVFATKWSVLAALFWVLFYPLMFKPKPPKGQEVSPAYTNSNGGKGILPENIVGDINELIGLEDIKQEILQIEDMIRNKALYHAHDVVKPFNILMSGPAGTGKTKMASYLAKSLNIPMFSQPAGALETGLIGGGSQTLNDLYKQASIHPMSLVFLDEGQVLLEKRGKDLMRKNADDTANTLLSILDGTNTKGQNQVITVIASNFNDASYEMDAAMLRRFPIKIDFRLPNLEERKEILKYYLDKKDSKYVDYDNINLNYIADITSGLSPALLNAVTDKASLLSIQETSPINTNILFRAFERTTVGITDRAQTAGRDEERRRISIHELGHFFTQISPHIRSNLSWDEIKTKSRFLKISTEAIAKVNALGYVLNSQDENNLKTLSQLEQEIVELYGGAAAEEVFYGKQNISVGSSNDFEKVTRIIDIMVNKLSMYSESKLNYSLLTGEKNNIAQAEQIAMRLYSDALNSVRENESVINKLADLLMENYVLTKDEIFTWLADHYFQIIKAEN